MVDVSQYELVPEHTKFGDEAVEDVLWEYNVEKMDPPKIKLGDPALPKDTEPDGVVKIIWNFRATNKIVVYRLVIE